MRRALRTTVLAGVVALGSLVWGAAPAHAQGRSDQHHNGYRDEGTNSRGYDSHGVYRLRNRPAYRRPRTNGYNPNAFTPPRCPGLWSIRELRQYYGGGYGY